MIQERTKKHMPALAERNGRLIWEKRREPRYPAHDPAIIRIFPNTNLAATVVDVSRNGLRLKLRVRVAVHSQVEITIQPSELVLFGEVRYCGPAPGGYYAGVSIRGAVFPETENERNSNQGRLV